MRRTFIARTGAVMIAMLGVTLSGCLISGTEAFSIFIGDITASGGVFNSTLADLEGNSTYEDHKDDIQVIDRLGWTCRVVNPQGSAATVSVYASPQAGLTPAEVMSEAVPVMVDFSVPANGTRNITYDESLTLISEENLDAVKDMALNGNFTFYTTANGNFTMNIEDLELIITFTVGL